MPTTSIKIPVAISSCLLGENVRYDGGHQYQPIIAEKLSELFDFHTICPEIAIGLGVPRNPIQLTESTSGLRVLGVKNKETDVTDALQQFAHRTLKNHPPIYGYIFKARSPSCGVGNTKVINETGQLIRNTENGAYADVIIRNRTYLPVTDESRLVNEQSLNLFINEVKAYHASQTRSENIDSGKQ